MNSEDIKNAQAKGLDTLKLMKLTALSKMNENDKSKLSENVKLFAEKGDASGIELCNKLAASLEANNGEITDETKEIMADIEARAAAADPTAQVDVNEPTDKNLNDVKKKVDKAAVDRKAKMTLEAETDKKSFTLIFKEVLPFYLFIGMTNDEFYFQDVELAKCYRQVYEIKEDRHNSHMWLQGMYIYDAISTSLYNVFCRKSRQQAKAKVWMNMLVNCYE